MGVGNITETEVINVPSPDFLKNMAEILQNVTKRCVLYRNKFCGRMIKETNRLTARLTACLTD